MKKIYVCLALLIAGGITDVVADVPALPAAVITSPAAMPLQPQLTADEMAKNCTDNAHKAEAVNFIEQIRYVKVLKDYLTDLKLDLENRHDYLMGISNNITDLKQRIADDTTLMAQVEKQLQQVSAQLGQMKQELQSNNSLQDLMNTAIKGLEADQKTLASMTGQLVQAQPLYNKLTQADKDLIKAYIKWIKFHRDYISNVQKSINNYKAVITALQNNQPIYGGKIQPGTAQYAAYAKAIPNYQSSIKAWQDETSRRQQKYAAAFSSTADALLDAAHNFITDNQGSHEYDVTYAVQGQKWAQLDQVYGTESISQQQLQGALNDLQIVQQVQGLNQRIQDIQSTLAGQLDAVGKGFTDEMQNKFYIYNLKIQEANMYVMQKGFFQQTIDEHQTDITALSVQINTLETLMSKQLVPAIEAAGSKIQQIATALQNPPSGMFDACPNFLSDLLPKAGG